MALKIDSKFEEKLTIAFKMKWRILQIFVHRLKNSDFISESQMVKLNQNGNSKLQDRPDAVWNFILNEWINEWMNDTISRTFYTSYRIFVLKV